MDVHVADGFFDGLKRLGRPWWHPACLWYSFKCWAWHRYTTIKPRYLNHEWCDRMVILPHMMFELLCQFIEDECSPGHIEWYGENGHKITVDGKEKYVMDEMKELRTWWIEEYHGRYPRLEDQIHDAIQAHDSVHRLCDFVEVEGRDDVVQWDPQYDTPENKERGMELLRRLGWHERCADAALERRLHRLLAVRHYMWT